ELVETGIRERVVLHLADRTPAGHAKTDRGADDPRLREWRVEAAIRAEAVSQPRRRAKNASGSPDVLAHHHDGWIAFELDVQAVVDRLHDGELSHRGFSAALRDRTRTTPADRRTRARTAARDPQPARPRRPRSPRASRPRLRHEPTPRARRAGSPRAGDSPRSDRRTRVSSPPRRVQDRCTRADRRPSRAAQCDTSPPR